ncbi:MAG TPA: 16S rRNA (guanine(527)-N(7))-methyltransferase RsmG [Fimbriimonadaceae bacterium]|nr:16S rRNA (guanine(527)-N(7))-methyltransferase RsmG [Fimbriimonadaceae bacterium]
MDVAAFLKSIEELGLQLSPDQVDQFTRFEEALYRANSVVNLTRVPQEEAWLRHFVDSLLFQAEIPAGSKVLDIGTGPGFPAWPLACARPDLSITAIDSSGKMLGFLASQPLPNLSIEKVRAEEWGRREEFDVVTGRAIAPLAIQLELSAAFVRKDGIVLCMRTPGEAAEIGTLNATQLGLQLEATVIRTLPKTEIVRLGALYRKVAGTPTKYPRTWAEIKRRPVG